MIVLDKVTKSYLTLRGRKVVFRDLSLEIPEGVNIALIGRNGAGKSTLMRLLSAVDLPDKGRVITKARLSWPVGLTGGLQQNLTGRDNVKFVCRIQGVRKAGMREKIRYVEEFAEIGSYFDQPVYTYSSGMRARLGFGMSMAFDFDYYLIDEVMSVGDANFKAKSRQVFRERLQSSKVIIVTHNMQRVRQMCDIVVHLEGGQATIYENVREGIAAYRAARDAHNAQQLQGGDAEAAAADEDELLDEFGDDTLAPGGSDGAARPRKRRGRAARAAARRARQLAAGGNP